MSTPIVRRRKKTVEVDTIQWTGSNEADVRAFTGATHFHIVGPQDHYRGLAADITAEVWDRLHSTWVGMKTGQHVACGVKGEFYPLDEAVLDDTYDTVDTSFFQPGHTYTRQCHGGTAEFLIQHIGTDPEFGDRQAFGWYRKQPHTSWHPYSQNEIEFKANGWTDATEAGEA